MAILPINEDILPLSEDYVLKAVLTHPDAKPALMNLISAVIDREVTDVQIRNNELPSTGTEEKNERLDVNCVIDDGSQVDVEMQGSKLQGTDNGQLALINKSVYYLTDLHSSQKSKGVEYENLVRTYQITFCAHNIFSGKEYITRAALRTEEGKPISDQIHLIVIELGKLGDILKKSADDMTSIEMWSTFLGYSSDPSKRELINKILEREEALEMAGTVLKEITKSEHARAKRMSQRKWETDMANDMLVSNKKAEARGREAESKKWKKVVADKDAELADKDAELARLRAIIDKQDIN